VVSHPLISFWSVGRRLFTLRDELKKLVGAFEPGLYPGPDAADLVAVFAEIERCGHVGKLLCAKRVKETDLHKQEGHKTAQDWLANTTGEPVGQAIADLENVERIEKNPTVSNAFRSGALSEAQANEIAAATEDCPGEAGALVGLAEFGTFSDLRSQ